MIKKQETVGQKAERKILKDGWEKAHRELWGGLQNFLTTEKYVMDSLKTTKYENQLHHGCMGLYYQQAAVRRCIYNLEERASHLPKKGKESVLAA
jgi:hypothetical protein